MWICSNVRNKQILYKWNIASYESHNVEKLNSGPPKKNPSSGRAEDLNSGPPDYKSSALPQGHARLPRLSFLLKL